MRRLMDLALAAAVVATVTVVALAWLFPAAAFRPVPGHDYPDLCRNRGAYAMPGVQTVALVVLGRVRYVDPLQDPNRLGRRDCVRVGRPR